MEYQHKLEALKKDFIILTTDEIWGVSLKLLDLGGHASCDVYWYYDYPKNMILANLYVDENSRNKKLGNKLIEAQESVAKTLDVGKLFLWVEEVSWMHDWYKRLGYVDLKPYDIPGFIWMTKTLT